MSRSHETRLAAVAKIRQRGEEMIKHAAEEEERLVAPTRNKLAVLFDERVKAFMKANIGRLPQMTFSRESLAPALDEFLEKQLFTPAERPSAKK